MKKNIIKPLISIIVPIYMIDQYLGLCIESIMNQTYKNIEIILVDDGSIDRCPELCDLYATKDSRIKVIHKHNEGLVSARKAGLQESNGSFIVYVDGDDWIESGFIETLYFSAMTFDADVVCAGFTRTLFSKNFSFLNAMPTNVYEGNNLNKIFKFMISCKDYYRPGITTYVWNKLFKREILLESQYLVDNRISIGEDAAVTYPALLKSKRIVITDNVDYHYRQRENSMLKQTSEYSQEAQKLRYLRDYMIRWAEKSASELNLVSQVNDYILANAIMRSGGSLPQDKFSIYNSVYYGKNVVILSAGTFGQQLVNRFKETRLCNVIAWLDDDYWEYRRCCLNVDSIESIINLKFDYILIAKVDSYVVNDLIRKLLNLGVSRDKILTVVVPKDKEKLINSFLDVDALKVAETNRRKGLNFYG